MEEEYIFLSSEWVHEMTRVVQAARSTDKDFGELTRGFSLSLVYLISELPQELREMHDGSRLVILVQLDQGAVKKLWLGTEVPVKKKDFTVSSTYDLAKRIFLGEINPATAFIDRKIKVDPMRRVYLRPRFTAKAIVTGNKLIKIARQVPTSFI